MIQLTRLNHQDLILNCDLIKFIEHAHDTVVTLVNGEKLTVEEAPTEILRRITAFRREQAEALEGTSQRTLRLLTFCSETGLDERDHG